ncbi:MAG: hypothetical protein ACTSO7_00160 [Candidatus Heimdallarchaeota archaeon]
MNCECKEKRDNKKCGEFEGKTSKEEQLKHLKECKEGLLNKVTEIDDAVKKLEA